MMMDLMTTDELAAMVKIPANTLKGWRQTGGGPAYRKLGNAVRYLWEDVSDWLDNSTVRNTAEAAERKLM